MVKLNNDDFIQEILDDYEDDPIILKAVDVLDNYEARVINSGAQVNQDELNRLKACYIMLSKVFENQPVKMKYVLHKPYVCDGYIEIIAKQFEISDIKMFLGAVKLAGSVQFCPLDNKKISLTIDFPRIMEVANANTTT